MSSIFCNSSRFFRNISSFLCPIVSTPPGSVSAINHIHVMPPSAWMYPLNWQSVQHDAIDIFLIFYRIYTINRKIPVLSLLRFPFHRFWCHKIARYWPSFDAPIAFCKSQLDVWTTIHQILANIWKPRKTPCLHFWYSWGIGQLAGESPRLSPPIPLSISFLLIWPIAPSI